MRAEESLNSDVVRHFAVRHDKKGMGEERGGGGEGRGRGGGSGTCKYVERDDVATLDMQWRDSLADGLD